MPNLTELLERLLRDRHRRSCLGSTVKQRFDSRTRFLGPGPRSSSVGEGLIQPLGMALLSGHYNHESLIATHMHSTLSLALHVFKGDRESDDLGASPCWLLRGLR